MPTKIHSLIIVLIFVISAASGAAVAAATTKISGKLDSTVVPAPVKYTLLAPEGFADQKDLPLVIYLHGGGGSSDNLLNQAALWEALWTEGKLPPMVFAAPSVAKRGFYMNFKDGSERWEDFVLNEFIPYIRAHYPVSQNPQHTFLIGASMGGMGGLRMAFRHPDRFGAVAALEPGIEPILKWQEMRPKHRFWRSDKLLEKAYGKPVDADYWAHNNPATMVTRDADRIRASGLQIYIDAADLDEFWLYEGAEFLHQILWQYKIRHEYHLVRGASHVGPSLNERFAEAAQFLVRSYKPWGDPPLRVRAVMQLIERQKKNADAPDHYNDGVVQPDGE